MKAMIKLAGRRFWIYAVIAWLGYGAPWPALALNICAVCGKEIQGPIYTVTDQVTGEKILICSNCLMLPRCYICGLPIKPEDAVELPDGRHLCARDAKTVVLDTDQAAQICAQVQDDLGRLFARFTSFPTNVDIDWIDRLDVQTMYQQGGYDIESPSLMGCIRPVKGPDGKRRYDMRLMTGLTFPGLKATCAHEYSHAWVRDNVPAARHARLAKDAEEGFCEMIAYLLMDSQSETAEQQFILRNHYTRGQVQLFIEAEKDYGFEDVLDWMRYGVTSRLESGSLDEIRDVQVPTAAANNSSARSGTGDDGKAVSANAPNKFYPAKPPEAMTIKLEGIMLGNSPVAIINGKSFFIGDVNALKINGTNVTIQCVAIQKNLVQILDTSTGKKLALSLPAP